MMKAAEWDKPNRKASLVYFLSDTTAAGIPVDATQTRFLFFFSLVKHGWLIELTVKKKQA